MKRFLIFIFALCVCGTAYADDITCPAGSYINDDGECVLCPAGTYSGSENTIKCTSCHSTYPNSEPGATDYTQCYSDWKHRTCPALSGCNERPCQYRAYVKKEREGTKWIYSDGEVKDGCSECPTSPFALPGYYFDGKKCEICPANTYSVGGEKAKCEPCPTGAFTGADGATNRAECMRILNYRAPNATMPTQIYLSGYKRTSPALAFGIGDDVFYANMTQTNLRIPGKMYVKYNSKTYRVNSSYAYGGYKEDDAFYISTTPDTDNFALTISPAGNFTIDWGDGNVETFDYDTCALNKLSHTYDTPGQYIISLKGRATEYCFRREGTQWLFRAIQFADTTKIAEIDGSLGAVFPTLSDGTNPSFYHLFSGATNLTGRIPSGLFRGITGSPSDAVRSTVGMFRSVFEGCSGLTGQIPVGLFGDLSGAPEYLAFGSAFKGCSGLTGPAATNPDGTPLYDIEYNGQTWYEQLPSSFTDMYTDSGISE